MPRKARAEVEGGLYHLITRGNNRRPIFNSPDDYEKFLSLLAGQKIKVPFCDEQTRLNNEFNAQALIEAVEEICRVPRGKFFGSGKSAAVVGAKEMFILSENRKSQA